MKYIRNNDFKKIYCKKHNTIYWILGYFGGGSVNFEMFASVAKEFSDEYNVDINEICIDEIFKSNWCKHFKFINAGKVDTTVIEIDDTHIAVESFWTYVTLK